MIALATLTRWACFEAIRDAHDRAGGGLAGAIAGVRSYAESAKATGDERELESIAVELACAQGRRRDPNAAPDRAALFADIEASWALDEGRVPTEAEVQNVAWLMAYQELEARRGELEAAVAAKPEGSA